MLRLPPELLSLVLEQLTNRDAVALASTCKPMTTLLPEIKQKIRTTAAIRIQATMRRMLAILWCLKGTTCGFTTLRECLSIAGWSYDVMTPLRKYLLIKKALVHGGNILSWHD